MGALEVAKMIGELGVLVVIAGIFLALSYRSFKNQQGAFDKLIDKILNNKLLEPPEPTHPSKEVTEKQSVINDKLYEECKGLLNALNADRSYIVLFHNGGKSQSGFYFQKMSCICEVVSSGIQPLSAEFQNVHRSSYSYMLDLLKENDEVLVDDVKKYEKVDAFLYGQAVHRHVYSTYMRLLKDIEGSATGFIGIDYCSPVKTVTTEQISDLIKKVGLKVSSLVDIRDEVE